MESSSPTATPQTREPIQNATNRDVGSPQAGTAPAPARGRRVDRTGNLSSEDRKRLMAEPAVRRAVELCGGSIVDVVRRGVPVESEVDVGDAATAAESAEDVENGADESALLDVEARDSGAN